MELKIKNDKKNDLLSRREVEFYIISDGPTPSSNEVHTELCKSLNSDPLSTIITKIDQRFGIRQSMGYAHIYESAEIMNKSEPKHILARKDKHMSKPEATESNKETKPTTKEDKSKVAEPKKEVQQTTKEDNPAAEVKPKSDHIEQEKSE